MKRTVKVRPSLFVVAAVLGALLIGPNWPGSLASAQTTSGTVTITAQQTSYGSVLFTGDGRALYMLTYDTPGSPGSPARSSCSGNCVNAWPPLLASNWNGPFETSGSVQPTALGTILRSDGTYQVTYGGYPLYMFIGDKAAGQTNGENVGAFNGLWHLMSVRGQPDTGVATVSVESSPEGNALSTPTAFNTHRSLYLLTGDGPNASICLAACARFWPPLLTSGAPVAGDGTDPAGLGTIRRPDGTMQVTYFGTPVYLFAFDLGPGAKSGLTNGEDFVDPGFGLWYLLSPSGTALPGPATVASMSSPFGSVLGYDPSGSAKGPSYPLYAFSADTATSSACTEFCARIWTPLLTNTAPQAMAGSGIDQTGLGTIQRSDGTMQITYHGHPLYLFMPDFSGTSGQARPAFGGIFQLMQVSGTPSSTVPAQRSVVPIPQMSISPSGTMASFVVSFSSTSPGQGEVFFGSGPGCSGLIEVATRDTGAGTTDHTVTVQGNDLPGSMADNGIQPGATYSFEVVTVTASGMEIDDNGSTCYTVTIPSA